MKRFILNILLLLIIIFLLAIIGELFVRSLPNPYKYKDEWMCQNADSIETLILGTSQSEIGINPHIIDNAFNLALTNGTLEYDSYLLKKYASQYKKLKNVIIELSHYNLYVTEFEKQPGNIHKAMYYRVYMRYPKHPFSPIYNFEFANLEYFKFHIEAGIGFLFCGSQIPDMCDNLGWVRINRCLENENLQFYLSDMKKTIKDLNSFSISNDSKNCRYIDEIVSFCIKNNITPYIIILPISNTLYMKIEKERLSNFKKTVEHYQKTGIKVIDYLNNPMFGKEDYYNSNHLNSKGSEKITRMINYEIKHLENQ